LWAVGYRPTQLPLGAILGTVELVGVIPTDLIWCERGFLRNRHTSHAHLISRREWLFGDYNPGRFAWKLANRNRTPSLCCWRIRLGLGNGGVIHPHARLPMRNWLGRTL